MQTKDPQEGADGCTPFVADPHRSMTMPTWWRFSAPFVLVVAVFVVFMPALDAGLVQWDDDAILWNVTKYQRLDGASLRWMFTTSFAGHFQPLTWLTYMFDWVVWKRQMFGYHLTSVVIHALTTLVFYSLVRRLLMLASGRDSDVRSTAIVLSAFAAASVFALHPLRAETVVWLAARSGLVAGFFFVACVTLYVRYAWKRDAPPPRERELSCWWFYGGAVVACMLSLLAKASGVTLPIVVLILDWHPLHRLGRRSPVGTKSTPQPAPMADQPIPWATDRLPLVLLEKVPFVLLAVAAGVRAYIARREGGALHSLAEHDVFARVAQAAYGLVFYAWKTVWPIGLGPLYEIPPRETLLGWMLCGSLLVLLGIGQVLFLLRRRWPALPAAFAIYAAVLLPVSGIIQSGPQLVADRYSYISCLGFAVVAGGAVYGLLRRFSGAGRSDRRAVFALVSAVVLAVLARGTYAQANIWLAGHTLWERGVRVSPDSAIAHTNYADALVRVEMFREAAEHYRIALTLDKRDVVALHHYADLQRRFGRTEAAIRLYFRALSVDPHRHRACLDLAKIFVRDGQPAKAVRILRQGMSDNPKALHLSAYLASLLASHPDAEIRDGQEAVRWALHVNRRNGGEHLPTLLTLATALAEAERFEEAVATADKALLLAENRGDVFMASELHRRLVNFRQHKPYRMRSDE